jgi:signal transduction histidine kinase
MTSSALPCQIPPQAQTQRDVSGRMPGVTDASLSLVEQSERATHRLAALGEMTGGIAHDFRNLLAVIEAGLRLAERRAEEPESVRAYIAAAREGIDRGIELTSLLLAFAKHQELDAHVGDVNEFLRSFEPFLRYGAGPDVRIKLELSSDVPPCLIDPALFDAAVLNLVVNARDAMTDGGEIRIITERLIRRSARSSQSGLEAYARVRIKDSGCGMSEEVLQQVFNQFFTTKGEKGTGLGLSQVRAFMQMVGGDVGITSEPGTGTIVDLLFPASQPCV